MQEVDMGLNVYEFNKNIMKQLPVVEEDAFENIKSTFVEYLENTPAEQYLMLLCKERADYTLFNFYDKWDVDQFTSDIFECFANRGLGIVNLEIIDNGIAVEIWVKQPDQMENADLYYLFPADQMVIEY
jgi:hypothetical protein